MQMFSKIDKQMTSIAIKTRRVNLLYSQKDGKSKKPEESPKQQNCTMLQAHDIIPSKEMLCFSYRIRSRTVEISRHL